MMPDLWSKDICSDISEEIRLRSAWDLFNEGTGAPPSKPLPKGDLAASWNSSKTATNIRDIVLNLFTICLNLCGFEAKGDVFYHVDDWFAPAHLSVTVNAPKDFVRPNIAVVLNTGKHGFGGDFAVNDSLVLDQVLVGHVRSRATMLLSRCFPLPDRAALFIIGDDLCSPLMREHLLRDKLILQQLASADGTSADERQGKRTMFAQRELPSQVENFVFLDAENKLYVLRACFAC